MKTGAVDYPFVRLILARYQVNSIRRAQLSKVVLADFVQLVPERTASLSFSDPTLLSVSVTGTSPTKPI